MPFAKVLTRCFRVVPGLPLDRCHMDPPSIKVVNVFKPWLQILHNSEGEGPFQGGRKGEQKKDEVHGRKATVIEYSR